MRDTWTALDIVGRWTPSLRRPAVWALLAATATLVVLTSAASAQAQAVEGLEVDATTTYTLDDRAGVVRVRVKADLVNTEPARRVGNYIQTPYFDTFPIPALGPVDNIRATSSAGGGNLSVDVEERDGVSVLLVKLSPTLVHGSPQTLTVDFDLPGQRPRSRSVNRVNDAYASWFVFGVGDPGRTTIVLDLPRPFKLFLTEDVELHPTAKKGRSVHTIEGVKKPEHAVFFASASNDRSLTADRVKAADIDVTLKAWPDDDKWRKFATKTIKQGLPALKDLIGAEVPERHITVLESARAYQLGYAGFYDSRLRTVEVGDEFDAQVVLHELSHIWLNHDLFQDRWVNEGLADVVSVRATEKIGEQVHEPRPIDRTARGAVVLNEWSPGALFDPAAARTEEFAYNASHYVMEQVADEIGDDGLRNVLSSAISRQIAYRGDGDPEEHEGVADWRYFYDLAELVGGSENIGGHFGSYVVTDKEAALLREREDARESLAELAEAGNGWAPPLEVRQEMAKWKFDKARLLMKQSKGLLDRSQVLGSSLDELGIASPDALEAGYEGADSLRDYNVTLKDFEAVTEDVLALRGRRGGVNPVASLGLVGGDAGFGRASELIGSGDLKEARVVLAQSSDTLDGATFRGTMILIALLLICALVWALLRFRRLRRGSGQPPDPKPDAEREPIPAGLEG